MKTYICLFIAFVNVSIATTHYVNHAVSSGNGDGSSWSDAFADLQQALDTATSGEEIWVAGGTYYPSVEVGGTGSRYRAFRMINNVAIYGGFAGTETSLNQRDIQANKTILSGDIGVSGSSDNSYHVFYHPAGLSLNSTAILNGFTITAGNADGSGNTRVGGGMCNDVNNSPTLINCTFKDNWAGFGGGMYNNNSHPTVTNCIFIDNFAFLGGGLDNYNNSNPIASNCIFIGNTANNGGGMENESGSNPVLFNCSFLNNQASYYGGGLENYFSSGTIVKNCTFTGNSAAYGGGIDNYFSSDTIVTNCTFIENAAVYGGGMENYSGSNSNVSNCIFSGNIAEYGGGMDNSNSNPTVVNCTFSGNMASAEGGGISNSVDSSPRLANCVLWDNVPGEIHNLNSMPIISHSDISGCLAGGSWDTSLGVDGSGNMDADPLFVDADGVDNIIGTNDDNLRLRSVSPCIEAGDNTAVPVNIISDLDGFPRSIDDICTVETGSGTPPLTDMGAFEYLRSDINSDGTVGLEDFVQLSSHWSDVACGFCAGADLTCDGNVDISDLWEFAVYWLAGSDL